MIAGLCGAVALGGCQEPTEANVADEALVAMEADGVAYGMVDYVTTEGILSAVIRADTAYQYNDSSVVHLWGVDMTLYHEDGRERAHVTSLRGVLHQRTEEMVARGDVVLTMFDSAERVESSELHYDPRGEAISSDSASVWYRSDGRTTRGTCFRSDLDFTSVDVCQIRGAAEMRSGRGGGGA